jgi:hypothetical protein
MSPAGEHDGPRVVPVYALTGGRARSRGEDLQFETLVTGTEAGRAALPRLRFEQARIVELCDGTPQSVVELASMLQVPLGVARVLVSDLHADGLLSVHLLPETTNGRPGTEVLERLLSGLRSR